MGASTLIVGLGGMGLKVVRRLAMRVEAEGLSDVEFVAMDTDVNDLRQVHEENPRIHTVQTSPSGTVGAALNSNSYARELWFPVNDGLTGKPFTEGAGQVRAVSRLAFDHAVEQGEMAELEKAIEKLRGLSGNTMRQEMRVMITGSLAGGTGSGLILPVAMYIRNFLITRYQDNSAIIRGFFLEPDTIFDVLTDEEERNSLRCNAYAALRELDAFFRKEYAGSSKDYKHVVFNAPQPGLGERVDYPNILPYHFVFLMDAINSEGEHLASHDAYLNHAVDSIYAQALSAVSSRSNSSEDNVIRKLAANNGRSRYCGAGSAYLEYPMQSVQKYLALKWAKANISNEWLEIDDNYRALRRDGDETPLREYYVTSFNDFRKDRKFYRKASKGVDFVTKLDGGEMQKEDYAPIYVQRLISHAEQWNEGQLLQDCGKLKRCLDARGFKPLPATPEAIEDTCAEDMGGASAIQGQFVRFFNSACSYSGIVSEEISPLVKGHVRNAFMISEYDDDPISTRTADWQFENVIQINDGGVVGALHPAAVRFLLYAISIELDQEIESAASEMTAAELKMRKIIDSDFFEGNDAKDDVGSAVGLILESGEGKKLKIPFLSKSALDGESVAQLARIAGDLNNLKKRIDEYRKWIVVKTFLEGAKEYVDALAGAYEAFYSYLGGQIAGIEHDIDAIEYDSRFNATRGNTHKYVCASTACLRALDEECPIKGDSGDLPSELCGDIYRSLLRFAKIGMSSEKGRRQSEVKNQSFDHLFSSTILDYWNDRVLDPQYGYPQKVDKNVIQAIIDEALYVSDEAFLDKSLETRYVEGYLLDTLDQAHHLAAPFIEPPVEETPRNIRLCAYSREVLDGVGPYFDALKKKFGSYNGVELKAREFSKYTILFYRSMYGFCATNLPKYAPAQDGLQSRSEGEYHRAYFNLVNRLSPNLKENKDVTPHIDKNWHLVAALPDLSEENERRINNDIAHAFLYGLIFQEFDADQVNAGDDIYYLKATANQPRADLWVSNGTACDRFYEVFDALKYNPPVVRMLLDRSEARMIREKNSSIGLTVEKCKLVRHLRSRAFKETVDHRTVIEAIHSLVKGSSAAPDATLFNEKESRLSSSLVTDMFGFGLEGEGGRRSILEIPLFYKISLPQSEERAGEIEAMIESIFSTVKAHLGNFCDEIDLDDKCGQLFEEQYVLFERNLVEHEKAMSGMYANRTVNTIREKTLSFVEPIDARHDRIQHVQSQIKAEWQRYREVK